MTRRRPVRPAILPVAAALAALASCAGGCILDERRLGYAPDATVDVPTADEGEPDVPLPPMSLVDLLFVVDNSGSMAQEQQALADALPGFFRVLFDAAATRSIDANVNVGVVSTDMGTRGYVVSTCAHPTGGDDGCLQHTPSPAVADCDPAPPSFLNRQLSYGELYPVEQLAHDFACIATLGTQGCGFEQQFEAARKALIDNTVPGGCTEGLIRPKSVGVLGSVVGLIFVTDENDCTVRASHPEMFDQDRTDLGHLNIRCFLHADFLTTVGEYVAALRGFTGEGHRLFVGALVGVPPDVPACTGFGGEVAACLSETAMQEQIDPAQPTQLIPSCNTVMGLAFPPRRFVELAQQLGANGYVASICATDYTPAFEAMARRIVELL